MNRLVSLIRLLLIGCCVAPGLLLAETGTLVVSLVGDAVAPPNELYPLNVVVSVGEGMSVVNLRVTNALPPGLVLNGFVAPPGTTFIPGGAFGVWRIGNISGPTDLKLTLVFQGRPADEIYRFQATLGYPAGPTDDRSDDSAHASVAFGPQTDCVGIPGIVARWRGERNALVATDVLDSVGDHHGKFINYPTHGYYTNGQSCRSFYFDGGGGGVYVPSSPDLEFDRDEDLSVAAWVKMDLDQGDIGNLVILDKRVAPLQRPGETFSTAVGYLFSLYRQGNSTNSKWLVEFQMVPRPLGSIPINNHSSKGPDVHDGRWHHVAVSVRRNIAEGGRFFIDGAPAGTFDPRPFNHDLRPDSPSPQLQLGIHATPGFPARYKGAMDDVALYRRALNDQEMRQSYQAGVEHDCCRNIGLSIGAPTNSVAVASPFDVFVRATRTPGRPPTGLVITNEIPPGLTYLLSSPEFGSVTNVGQKLLWNLDSLGSADSATLRIRYVAASAATNFLLHASVGYSGPPDDDADDDTVDASVESSGVPPCQPLAGLLGWWPGNETTQDIVSTNRGVPTGSMGYTNGIVRSGFVFDGAAGVLRVGDPAEFHLQDLSIEAWVRRGDETRATAAPGSGGFLFASDTGGYGFGLLDDGRLMLSQVGLSFVPSSRGITETTNWHHVAVTKSGSNVLFYLDGRSITSTNMAARFVFNRPFAVGGLGGQVRNVFLGAIDDLALYNRPLTGGEIAGIYDAGSRGKCRTGLAVDENTETPTGCELRFVIETIAGRELVFLTAPDSQFNFEASTNLVDWVPMRRLSNVGGEVRGLINPTGMLFYRCAR